MFEVSVSRSREDAAPQEAREIAERIEERDNFGRQASARLPGFGSPFCAGPGETRTMVPSIMAYSKSGSPYEALNRSWKTPPCRPAANRRNIEFSFRIRPEGLARAFLRERSKALLRQTRDCRGRADDRRAYQEGAELFAPTDRRSGLSESRLVSIKC